MPYFQCKTKSGEIYKILVDTGSNKNYVQPKLTKKIIENDQCFYADSVGGKIKITHHTFINLFNINDISLKFYLLPSLTSFHAILGNDSLKQLSAVIHTKDNFMVIQDRIKIKLKQLVSQNVNLIKILDDHLNEYQNQTMQTLIQNNTNLFSEPDERLTYTTKVLATIRTNTDTPVYSKSYPYPMSLKEEIEKEINKLLNDGIIRVSKSPYNSPVWIVPKKQDASKEKKYRMVIDYRKLNAVTIADRYPMPDFNDVLPCLSQNKWFSIIDLKSGFHQIPLKETDVEKTAFSINQGKYEFTRLPFGLKNAPAIFQRALDDILREHIGKICFVYIDDIVIFSPDEKSHANHISKVFETLAKANMKVQVDKCQFFKKEIEYLGFVISSQGVSTNPTKVQAIVNVPYPNTLKELRSFLGLSGYYRRFVMDYAKIAKPLTTLLRGEDGRVSKNVSKNKTIDLNENAKKAFDQIKNALISKEVVLAYPNYNKEFHLTTDASNYAIGAVLEQDNRPITYISRTLSKTEESYAANERELLAIIWALKALRNYLYGTAKIKIFTDHQPLIYALSNKNDNAKLKRWKSILEEYDHEIIYKPGKSNVVADALSRPSHINSLSIATHSDESSSHNLITTTEVPINVFKNQIFIVIDQGNSYKFSIPFPTYHRHTIKRQTYSEQDLIDILKRYLNPSVINGLCTSESIMGTIQNFYPDHFRNYKIRYTQLIVKDLVIPEEQEQCILVEHRRAHRNAIENKNQLLERVYFPHMLNKVKNLVKQCRICNEQKYDRHPPNPVISATPIPQYPGQIVHLDIYIAEKRLILTAIDKFSKYAQTRILLSRAVEHVKEPLRQLLMTFGTPEMLVIDNEKAFNSASIMFMLEDQLKIKVYRTPPYMSNTNGQVERFHSTLSEILRCLKKENISERFEELLDNAVYRYNLTIHSTTKYKPIELFFGRRVSTNPEIYEQIKQNNIQKLKAKQDLDLKFHNKNRKDIINYTPGQTIYVKINKRQGTKLTPRYKTEIVKENRTSTVLTESGRIIHKSLIRN